MQQTEHPTIAGARSYKRVGEKLKTLTFDVLNGTKRSKLKEPKAGVHVGSRAKVEQSAWSGGGQGCWITPTVTAPSSVDNKLLLLASGQYSCFVLSRKQTTVSPSGHLRTNLSCPLNCQNTPMDMVQKTVQCPEEIAMGDATPRRDNVHLPRVMAK